MDDQTFSYAPDLNNNNPVPANKVLFGQTLTGVTQITLSDLQGGHTTLRGWQEFAAFSAVPEPSAALLGGLGVLALLRRRRA